MDYLSPQLLGVCVCVVVMVVVYTPPYFLLSHLPYCWQQQKLAVWHLGQWQFSKIIKS